MYGDHKKGRGTAVYFNEVFGKPLVLRGTEEIVALTVQHHHVQRAYGGGSVWGVVGY